MINSGFRPERYILPIAIACAGVVLAWIAKEPSGLLIAVAGVSLYGGRRVSLLSTAGFGLAIGVFVAAIGWHALAGQESNLRLAVILATALGTTGLIYLNQANGSSGHSETLARMIVESMPGHGWAADPNGKFIYVSPSTLKYLGQPTDHLDRIEGTDEFGWRQVVHPEDYDRVVEQWLHCLETGQPYENEHRIRRFDGTYRWFRNAGMPSRDGSGRITGWYGSTIDIHEQKTAEFALRESERRFRDLFHYMPIGLTQVDASKLIPLFKELRAQGVADLEAYIDEHPEFLPRAVEALEVEEANQHIIEMFGAKNAEEMRGPITRYWQPGIPTIRRSIEARYRGQEVFQEETKVARIDGSSIDVLFTTARPGAIADKSLVGFIDITERKKAEQALRERERELSQIVDMVPVHIRRLSPEGNPTFFNKRLMDFSGLKHVSDLDQPGMSRLAAAIKTLIHPDDAASLLGTVRHAVATGEPYSMKYRMRHADGSYRWVDGRAEPLRDESGAIVQWYAISIDIDDEMRAQEALRGRERELSQLVDMVPSFLWRLSPEGDPVFFSKRMIEFVGLDVGDYDKPGMSGLKAAISALVHPEDTARMGQALSRSLATGESFSLNYRIRRADGVYRWVSGRAEPMRDENGRIVQWYGLSHDIHDQMQAEEALRERERFLWQLVETLPAMIDCAAPNGEPIYRSKQLRDFLGYELEELDGSGTSRLNGTLDAGVHPDDVAGVKEQYGHSLATGEPYRRKHRLRRADGEYLWVDTRAAPMRNAEGVIVQWNVICLDIDGEVRAQEELRLAQEKMARASQAASLAELSASIAHEVNQPLAAIVATSHACRRWLSATPPNLERAKITLDRIIRDANSASEVVSRIRALFSQMTRSRSPAYVTEVITEVRRLLADELATRNINVETEFDANLPPARIDRVQIQQVLANLIRNAIDASDAVSDGIRRIRLRAVRDGQDAVRVEVQDAGAGMKEPERAFEPFFTTKPNGMGMGLAICRSIIESHNGRLWATGNEPRGTTLAFTLPIREGAAT